MSTKTDFDKLTQHLDMEGDCPVCGFAWPGCHGLCVSHESANGLPGPYHQDWNDDCPECEQEKP